MKHIPEPVINGVMFNIFAVSINKKKRKKEKSEKHFLLTVGTGHFGFSVMKW